MNNKPLSSEQVKQWREEGYVVVRDLFDKELLKKSTDLLQKLIDTEVLKCRDFGSDGKLEFPSLTVLDHVTMHENLINSAKQLLNQEEILLLQADSWAKKGGDDFSNHSNNDQRIHCDYGNNTFLSPPPFDSPEVVAAIVYFSNIEETGGGTSYVPREGENDELYQMPYVNMPGIAGRPFFNDKSSSEEYFLNNEKDVYDFRQKLYGREKNCSNLEIGDVLFYRLDLWHRGTPVKKDKIRFVMNLEWKKRECYWISQWNPGFTKRNYYGKVEELFTNFSVSQRGVLGVPLPKDPYWNQQNIQYLKVRYPNIDITPYLDGLKK